MGRDAAADWPAGSGEVEVRSSAPAAVCEGVAGGDLSADVGVARTGVIAAVRSGSFGVAGGAAGFGPLGAGVLRGAAGWAAAERILSVASASASVCGFDLAGPADAAPVGLAGPAPALPGDPAAEAAFTAEAGRTAEAGPVGEVGCAAGAGPAGEAARAAEAGPVGEVGCAAGAGPAGEAARAVEDGPVGEVGRAAAAGPVGEVGCAAGAGPVGEAGRAAAGPVGEGGCAAEDGLEPASGVAGRFVGAAGDDDGDDGAPMASVGSSPVGAGIAWVSSVGWGGCVTPCSFQPGCPGARASIAGTRHRVTAG
ncbi:hypothetical protein GCM10027087_02070 [Paractinoplanes abujensis]